ncbi:hypothetical protein K1719_027652 [Acacia pycnantha]|nr:hypothetical protein K1719_027652 [Acacia pycnantha]
MLIDFIPTVSSVSLAESPGLLKALDGAPANVAIAVSRLGGQAAFVGKLGDNEFGHILAGILKQNCASGVELEYLTESDKIDDASAMSLWHLDLKLLLVTLGEHGCTYYTKSFDRSVRGCFSRQHALVILLSAPCCARLTMINPYLKMKQD